MVISAFALMPLLGEANAQGRPVIETVVDRDSGAIMWSSTNPTVAVTLKPGQEILIKGHVFGLGPMSASRPGLAPPAGGTPPADGTFSVAGSPSEASGEGLFQVLFGKGGAVERKLFS